ncbi:MAG: maleylpyruvate isomerase family mycothiol-dependent enzyme [Actinomycetes bacterium]
MTLDPLTSIPRDARATAAVLAAVGPDAAVPATPEWDLGRLVKHMGMVLAWQTASVERRPEQVAPRSLDLGLPEDRADYGPWLVALADLAVAVLRGAPADDECWTWTDDRTVGFWSRRLMHEIAVHRWDAESALGAPSAIEADVAVDAIDELLTVLVHRADVPSAGSGETIHLHATDAEGEWLITRGAAGMTVLREHAKGDVAVRGSANDLLLVIMGRIDVDAVEVLGDGEVLAAWRGSVRF